MQSSTIIPSLSSSAFSAAVPSLTGGYKYRFTALRPFAFESACTRPQPRGRLDVEHHTSSSSSSSWPDTDRAPSFRRGYHRKTHAALKYCGAADVLSLLSLPPYSSTRLPIGITSFFPDPSTRTHARVIGTSMDHDFTTTVFVTEEGRPQRRLRSAKRHLLSACRLSLRAPRCSRFSFSLHPSLE